MCWKMPMSYEPTSISLFPSVRILLLPPLLVCLPLIVRLVHWCPSPSYNTKHTVLDIFVLYNIGFKKNVYRVHSWPHFCRGQHLSLKMNVNIYLVSSRKIVTTIHWCVGFCWWQQVNCILPVSYCWCVMTNITLSETFALLSFLTTCLIKKSAERVKKAHSLTSDQHKNTMPEQLRQVLKNTVKL